MKPVILFFPHSTAEVIQNTYKYYEKCPLLLPVCVILNKGISQRDSGAKCWWHEFVISQWLLSSYRMLPREIKRLRKMKKKLLLMWGLPQEVKSLSLLQKERESGDKELESRRIVVGWPTVQYQNLDTCVEIRGFLCVIQCIPANTYQKLNLKNEAEDSSELLSNIYQTTWRHIPEERKLDIQCRESLKSDGSKLC
jgi:hypothetical protein